MLCSIPVYAVLEENLGERGAHRTAFQEYLSVTIQVQKQKQRLLLPPSQREEEGSSSITSTAGGSSFLALTTGAVLLVIGAFVIGRSSK